MSNSRYNYRCSGPIVNLFSFTGTTCNNTDTNSPFFYQQKFTAVSPGGSSAYNSACQRIRTPSYSAGSFIYTSDGANTDRCYLNVYNRNDCTGTLTNLQLNDDVSECITQQVRSARVYCSPQVCNFPINWAKRDMY